MAASSATRTLEVIYRATDALAPDPRNARTHPKKQIDQICASVKAFGFANPLLIDPDGTIIAGHGRLLAAKRLGMLKVPTIPLPDLSDAQKRALRIADNKIALGAGWDLDLLKLEIGDLATLDIDLELTGFSAGEIDVILNASQRSRRQWHPGGPRQTADEARRHLETRPTSRRLRRWPGRRVP